jgi:hypothetical protein
MEVVAVMPTDTRGAELAPIRFEAELSTIDDTSLLRLPEAASEQLPSRGQVAVHATLDGHWFETVVEPDGRRGHWVRVERPLEQAAGIGPGDTAELTLEVAPHWPEPDVPEDLAAALAAAPARIRDVWEDITPMARWEWVRWVRATRNPATAATGRGEHLQDGPREAATVLFRPVLVHRPGPGQERQAARAVLGGSSADGS